MAEDTAEDMAEERDVVEGPAEDTAEERDVVEGPAQEPGRPVDLLPWYIETIDRLVARLESYRVQQRQALEDLRKGMSITESVRIRDSATLSRELAGVLEDFEEARRAMRGAVARALRDEGSTLREIGQAFGVSTQLASRFVSSSLDDAPT